MSSGQGIEECLKRQEDAHIRLLGTLLGIKNFHHTRNYDAKEKLNVSNNTGRIFNATKLVTTYME